MFLLVFLGFKELLELGLKKVLHSIVTIGIIQEAKLVLLVQLMSLCLVIALILSGRCPFRQILPARHHCLLELQDNLGVNYWNALWSTTINKLLSILLILGVVDRLSSLRFVEHGLQVYVLVHVCLRGSCSSVAWEYPKMRRDMRSALSFIVEIGAVGFLAFTGRWPAFGSFVIHPVVLLFFPTVAVATSVLKGAAIEISFGFLFCAPILTLVFRVVVDVHFAAKVLPVVRVDTGVTRVILVFFVTVRTPDCLEVKKIKVCVPFHSVQIVN